MADWSLPRKPRKSNFSTDEVDVLVDSVKAHYNILYGKFAKRATNRWIRQKAWLDILKKVNRVSIEKRTLQEVKNKWKKCQYALKEKVSKGVLADDPGDSSWDDMDSMPLQERLSKVAAQEKIAAGTAGPLKSQPLSPTKLKVTRQGPKVVKQPGPPPSPVNEEMCLRWNSHHSNMQTAFPNILSKEQYVDVTLAAEGKTLKCHRLILSSCSPYFEEILSGISPFQHPVLFMRDIPFWILKSLCDFMYAGEVHIFQNKLEELLTVAEALKIKGLAGKSTPPENQEENSQKTENTTPNNKPPKKPQEKEKNSHPPTIRKNAPLVQPNSYESTSHDYDDDLLDPLDLLEPLYEEAAEEKKPASTIVKPKENKFQYQPVKKTFTRRLRKRKYSEQREPSPPPVFSFRKGTRSRPNVKIPKYYHSDYSNPSKPAPNAQTDPLLDVDEIKTEPIDVEDNMIVYSDEDRYMEHSLEPANCDSPIIITSTKTIPSPDKFKRIKLTKPIITEVHTIEETNTTPGGLEVIKITLQQPEEEKKEEAVDPLQGVIITENMAVDKVPPPPPSESTIQGEQASSVKEIIEAEVQIQEPPLSPPPEEEECGTMNVEQETGPVEVTEETVPLQEIKIADVRSTCLEEVEPDQEEEVEINREGEIGLNREEEVELNREEDVDLNTEEEMELNREEESDLNREEKSDLKREEESDLNRKELDLNKQEEEEQLQDHDKMDTTLEGEDEHNEDEVQQNQSEFLDETEQNRATEFLEDGVEQNNMCEGFESELEENQMTFITAEEQEVEHNEPEDKIKTSLDHLEEEAMNVANAISMESQAGPPDIE